MAGRAQQYLRTEYIQPPPGPPTLDAKNSPLALLAQTCSAIGKDTTKVSSASKIYSESKRSPSSVALHKPPPSAAPVSRTPPMSSPRRGSVSPTNPRCVPLKREKSPVVHSASPAKKSRSSPDSVKSCPDVVKSMESKSDGSKVTRPLSDHKRTSVADIKRRHTTSFDESSSKHSADSHRLKSSPVASPNRSYSSSCGCPLTTSVSDSRHATHGCSSNSVSPHQANPMLSLYDSFCIGCQGPHVPGSSCYEGLKNTQLPFYPFANPASTYYAQMVMAAAARSGGLDPMPHVCNWVNVGSGSCGKRFATAEELSNHLRTHALPTTSAASGNNYLLNGLDKLATNPYAAYLSQQAAALAAVSPTAANPGVASNFLSRSHSPLGRYHPYKSSNMLGQLSAVPPIPIAAGAGAYCSPFALYGQRLGAAAAGFSYP
uniref:Zinc finger protein 703-like n=1 Tax=Phallusia mammillata TaxID=59560 RepID=A0A6F9DY08_9ASCI|nr:zinc finger protein 703-like [Phallusia mammillata]